MKNAKNIIIAILLIFLFSSLFRNIISYKNKYDFFQMYKTAYEKEHKKNIELKTEMVKKNSVSEIEKTIRNKLNLMKKDEVAIILPVPTISLPPITPTPLPIYLQWWSLFF